MRYVVVDGRLPFKSSCCAFCTKKLEQGYTREIDTRLTYCAPYCYEAHVYAANITMGAMDAPLPQSVLLLPMPEVYR